MCPRPLLFAGIAALFLSCVPAQAQKLPDWLQQAVAAATPTHTPEPNAVILLHEQESAIRPDGRIDLTRRYAVRILNNDGRAHALLLHTYNGEDEKITGLKIWIIRKDGGRPQTFARKDCVDASHDRQALYSEVRVLLFNGEERMRPGDVFAYEISTRESTMLPDTGWAYESTLPVLVSRIRIQVPPGWDVSSIFINRPLGDYRLEKSTHIWEARDLAPIILKESLRPSLGRLRAGLALRLLPPPDSRTPYRIFREWRDVAAYVAACNDPAAVADDAIAARTRELTAAAATDWERLQAIARYCQNTNYVAIAMGLTRGGGYTPFAASEVFRRNYGDCKDKTALMRAMLRAAGFTSYAVVARVGRDEAIEPGWPSPHQFDHCIVAIAVDAAIDTPAVFDHPELGRLLLFDPTDPCPIGEIYESLQDAYILVGAAETTRLTVTPQTSNEDNCSIHQLVLRLDESGAIEATLHANYLGEKARDESAIYRNRRSTDYRDTIQQWIARTGGVIRMQSLEVVDDKNASRFSFDAAFQSISHARLIGGRVLVFKPLMISRRGWVPPPGERRNPIKFVPARLVNTVEVVLPEGFRVDELPATTELQEAFATYTYKLRQEDERLFIESVLDFRACELPASAYDKVRAFYAALVQSEQAPVVLVRH
jgi:hypothetical protein